MTCPHCGRDDCEAGRNDRNARRRRLAYEARNTNRQPCSACGGKIPETRSKNAIYCSNRCKDRAVQARAKQRRADGVVAGK